MLKRYGILAAAAVALASSPALAVDRGGGVDLHDSYENAAQRNPRYIEPGGDYLASRYRQGYPQGYYDRQALAGRYGYGYPGNVYVRPYGYGY